MFANIAAGEERSFAKSQQKINPGFLVTATYWAQKPLLNQVI